MASRARSCSMFCSSMPRPLRQSEHGARAPTLSLGPGAPRTRCSTVRSIVHDKYSFPCLLSGASLLPSFLLRSFHFLWLRPHVSQPMAKMPHSSSDTQGNAMRRPRRWHLKKGRSKSLPAKEASHLPINKPNNPVIVNYAVGLGEVVVHGTHVRVGVSV